MPTTALLHVGLAACTALAPPPAATRPVPRGAAPPQDTQAAPIEGIRFGYSLLVLDDRTGDGVPELAVGAPAAKLGEERARPGVVLVLSGADRSVVQEWRGEAERGLFGHALRPVGDLDGDGHGDVIVGYEKGARCEVRSGQTGARLHAFDRTWSDVLALGDLDEDGADDLLLVDGADIEVRSGVDASLLHQGTLYGTTRAMGAGDLDGDGLTDLVTEGEAKQLWLSGRGAEDDRGPLGLFSRKSRRALSELWPEESWSAGVRILAVEPAGDLDGDGHADLWITLSEGKSGRVLALSPAHGLPLAAIEGPAGFGHTLLVPGDLNGDGTADIVVAQEVAPFLVQLRAHSGADGAELWHQTWDDGGMTVLPQLASLPPAETGGVPQVLVSGCDYRWHGWVQRNGFLQCMGGDTGEVRWRVEVDDVRPVGAQQDADSIYR